MSRGHMSPPRYSIFVLYVSYITYVCKRHVGCKTTVWLTLQILRGHVTRLHSNLRWSFTLQLHQNNNTQRKLWQTVWFSGSLLVCQVWSVTYEYMRADRGPSERTAHSHHCSKKILLFRFLSETEEMNWSDSSSTEKVSHCDLWPLIHLFVRNRSSRLLYSAESCCFHSSWVILK